MMKPSYFSLLVVIMLVLCSSLLQNSMAQPPLTSPSSCSSKCGMRCANAGVKDRCMKYCGICCKQCSCVPSGTYGNKSECPCYRDMLNAKGKPKCP